MVDVARCDQGSTCNSDSDEMVRAAGECLCSCGRAYWRHPYCPKSYSAWAQAFILHVTCDGRHVKL